MLEWLYL